MEKEKITPETLTDDWLIEVGYFKRANDMARGQERDGYPIIIITSASWKRVVDDCLFKSKKKVGVGNDSYYEHQIITPEMLCETLNSIKHREARENGTMVPARRTGKPKVR